jgi:predicted RNase H-like HicB family nuclease
MELHYTYWKDDGWYVGHLDDYPDYNTQGKTLEEFEDMLRSLYEDIKTYDFSFVRHHGTLKIA